MSAKPLNWATLWDEYPDYILYSSGQVKKEVGGAVDDDWIKNTCAIRLSRTLNYNKIPVPFTYLGMKTVTGADKKHYAFRVREIMPWLRHVLGKPDFEIKKKEGAAFDKTRIAGMKGIIGFDIHFSDATGHLDLWNGETFSSEHDMSRDYWVAATRIWLWKANVT